jgi:hypothetical protein
MRRMGQMRQKATEGATRTQIRHRWSVRRGLAGVGAVAALGALAACGTLANTADQASKAATKLSPAADNRSVHNREAPAFIRRATANARAAERFGAGPHKYAHKQVRHRKPTSPVATGQPSATAAATPTTSPTAAPTATASVAPTAAPSGSQSGVDPSGLSPATALSGFTLKYVQEFTGDSLPSGWNEYDGVPGGETSQEAQWEPDMCTFSGGEMHFMASGIDSCGLDYVGTPQEYGAFFTRLQADPETAGELFSDIFLLWPANNQWPPEIDVYEDGGDRSRTVASLFDTVGDACGSSLSAQCLAQYTQGNGDSNGVANTDTQWHTYGVEWTPSQVSWLIDGRVVFTAPASQVKSPAVQPALPMNIALQSQNLQGGSGAPSLQQTMAVDWVEQFSWNG